MSTIGRSSDALVDDFVRYANQAGFEWKFPDEVPQELRTSHEKDGMFYWQIREAVSNPWVEGLAKQLPRTFPRPYRSLVERYRFCNFEVGPVMFFANSGQALFFELSGRVFWDKHLFPTLHKHGYLEFGKPDEGNYDPVCFDMKRLDRDDAPIVQLDHEEILIRERIRVVAEIAPSFTDFLKRAIAEKLPVL